MGGIIVAFSAICTVSLAGTPAMGAYLLYPRVVDSTPKITSAMLCSPPPALSAAPAIATLRVLPPRFLNSTINACMAMRHTASVMPVCAVPLMTADKGVLLELVDPQITSWVKVRHRDGMIGFIKATDVWGI